jgi:hypothetical protein
MLVRTWDRCTVKLRCMSQLAARKSGSAATAEPNVLSRLYLIQPLVASCNYTSFFVRILFISSGVFALAWEYRDQSGATGHFRPRLTISIQVPSGSLTRVNAWRLAILIQIQAFRMTLDREHLLFLLYSAAFATPHNGNRYVE